MANCKICGKPTNTHPWYCDECMEKYPTDKEKFELSKKRQLNIKSTSFENVIDVSGIKGVFLILALIAYCIAFLCLIIALAKLESRYDYDILGWMQYIMYCSGSLNRGLIFTVIYFISNISEKVDKISGCIAEK